MEQSLSKVLFKIGELFTVLQCGCCLVQYCNLCSMNLNISRQNLVFSFQFLSLNLRSFRTEEIYEYVENHEHDVPYLLILLL